MTDETATVQESPDLTNIRDFNRATSLRQLIRDENAKLIEQIRKLEQRLASLEKSIG